MRRRAENEAAAQWLTCSLDFLSSSFLALLMTASCSSCAAILSSCRVRHSLHTRMRQMVSGHPHGARESTCAPQTHLSINDSFTSALIHASNSGSRVKSLFEERIIRDRARLFGYATGHVRDSRLHDFGAGVLGQQRHELCPLLLLELRTRNQNMQVSQFATITSVRQENIPPSPWFPRSLCAP